MATKTRQLQMNMTGGEVSPAVEARHDLKRFYSSVRQATNFLPEITGGMARRVGLRKVCETKNSARGVLIPFEYNVSSGFAIIATDLVFRFVRNDGTQVYTVAGAELVTNGSFPTDLSGWTDDSPGTSSSSWSSTLGGIAVLTAIGVNYASLSRTLTTVIGTTYVLTFEVMSAASGTATSPCLVGVGASPSFNNIHEAEYGVGTQSIQFTATSTATIIRFKRNSIGAGKTAVTRFDNVSVKAIGSTLLEVATPYVLADLNKLHHRQSADVIFIDHGSYQPKKLTRVNDASWSLPDLPLDPPPTLVPDFDLSGGTITLTPAATTGLNQVFTASAAIFQTGDVGRQIIYGASVADIITFTSSTVVRADILAAFPDTNPIPAGQWKLRLSPQGSLNVTAKKPVGKVVSAVLAANGFRDTAGYTDVGKYIKTYGGVLKITEVVSATTVKAKIMVVLTDSTTADPATSEDWTLEVASWSEDRGWPNTLDFHQGRLVHAKDTTFNGSGTDNYENYGIGALATDAIQYTIPNRKNNAITYLASSGDLILGDAQQQHYAKGPGIDEPLGGDVVPLVRGFGNPNGAAPMLPVEVDGALLFVDWTRKAVFEISENLDTGKPTLFDRTVLAEHLTETSAITQGAIGHTAKPAPRVYFAREDGALLVLTYKKQEEISGWSTITTTNGSFICHPVAIPKPNGQGHRVFCLVERVINGATKVFLEYFDDDAADLDNREWTSLQTDCATVYDGVAATSIPATHLEGQSVDVIADGIYLGRTTVTAGVVTLPVAASQVEIGLPYVSTLKTLKFASPEAQLNGIPKRWVRAWVDLYESRGGKINGEDLLMPGELGAAELFTGIRSVPGLGVSSDGTVTITQTQPAPMRIFSIFGTVELGDEPA